MAYDLKVDFTNEGSLIPMTPEIALCLFRIAQESLSNIIRHSGASWVEMRLTCLEKKAIQLTVTDNSRGFDPGKLQTDSLGIISMRERLRLVDGELKVHSLLGRGTEVIARAPLIRTIVAASPA